MAEQHHHPVFFCVGQLVFIKSCRGCFADVIHALECIFIGIPCDVVCCLHRWSCRWELQRTGFVGPLTLRRRCRKASKHMSLDCWYACFHMSAPSSFQHVTDSTTVFPCEPHCCSYRNAGALLCKYVQSRICLSCTEVAQQRAVSHPCRMPPLQCMQDTR